MSVRHTRAVEAVIQAAVSPIRVGDLTGKLAAEFPATPESVLEGMLAELVCALRDIHLGLSRHNRLSSPTERRELRISALARSAPRPWRSSLTRRQTGRETHLGAGHARREHRRPDLLTLITKSPCRLIGR